jgi:NitT/TauT family transport system substrate-binding protein
VRIRSRRPIFCAAIALALGAAAVLAPKAFAETTLNVGKAQATADSIITVDVGADQGIFQKHGLDLKIMNFEGGSRIIQALTAGSLDIAVGAGTQMSFVAKGAPMRAVCEDTTTLPYFSVGLPYDSPIHSLDELKGKKIGVSTAGSLTDWVAQELNRKKGWGPDGTTRVMVGGGVTASTAAFRSHQIDAYIGGTTSFLAEEEKQVGRVLVPVSDFVGNMASGTIFASNHLIETNPKIMSEEYDIVKGMFNASCRFDQESLANLKRSFIDLKLLDHEPDMSKLYTEAYLPK